MTKARSEQIAIDETPYYHCVSRCVRRAFLCGVNQETGECYEHRRQWIVERMRLLSSIFSIDICAYAVMTNHYHIVVKLNDTPNWSDKEVAQRWLCLHKGPLLIQRYIDSDNLDQIERDTVSDIISIWRTRLQSLSWFMKCLNEPIARMANAEDECTGHFWESRFKSQALLSEEALLTCMAYVDLNPVRARIADTPEESEFTSIKERIVPTFDVQDAVKNQLANKHLFHFPFPLNPLLKLKPHHLEQREITILFSLNDYLELVDWSGRIIRGSKKGYIPSHAPPILQRLRIASDRWLMNCQTFETAVHRYFKKCA